LLLLSVHLFIKDQSLSFRTTMSSKPLAQGKTKAIFAIDGNPGTVRIKSLDSLTAFNAKRKNEIEGKAELASKTTCNVFRFLNECGKLYCL
jgi:phosphoribosylaminoimidazole-succinocarboxamide synthase